MAMNISKRPSTTKHRIQKNLLPLPGGIQARARAMVGTGLSRLGWLLDLLNSTSGEIATRSEEEGRKLEAEVVFFCEAVGVVGGGRLFHLDLLRIQQLIDDVRNPILEMIGGGNFEIRIPAVDFVSTPDACSRYMGPAEALFPLAVARLIEEERARIRVCGRPGCGRLFVRRKRALYCSRQCSQIEQFKRFVAHHGSPRR
jgi:hypothetical protein